MKGSYVRWNISRAQNSSIHVSASQPSNVFSNWRKSLRNSGKHIRSLAKLIWWRKIASKTRQLFIENLSNGKEKIYQMEWNEIGTKSIASFIALVRLIGCKLLKHRIEADVKRFSVDIFALDWWKTDFRSLEISKWHFEIGF